MGRPTTYKGNKLTWNSNGKLLTYKDNIKYTYDINSIRTKKVVNGKTHNYVVNGTQILQEKIVEGTSTTIINYHYDLNKVIGFTYNKGDKTSSYIYRRNLQDDIIGIYDSLGNEVGEYAYDAYGKCYVKYNNNSSEEEKTILNTNPFRYRGYYYDNETGLYYLNARYYDPSIGRFISPDVLTILDETKGQINGLNLYMYCNNNPVMYVDPSGHAWWHWILGGLIVVALGIALVASAGSVLAAGVAIYSALCGIAFGGATTTVLSFAFVGAAMVYTGSLLYNAVNIATSELRGSTYSYSINRMEEMGGYVLETTVMMGASFGYAGYIAYLDQLWKPDMSYDAYRKKKWKELASIEGGVFYKNKVF